MIDLGMAWLMARSAIFAALVGLQLRLGWRQELVDSLVTYAAG